MDFQSQTRVGWLSLRFSYRYLGQMCSQKGKKPTGTDQNVLCTTGTNDPRLQSVISRLCCVNAGMGERQNKTKHGMRYQEALGLPQNSLDRSRRMAQKSYILRSKPTTCIYRNFIGSKISQQSLQSQRSAINRRVLINSARTNHNVPLAPAGSRLPPSALPSLSGALSLT